MVILTSWSFKNFLFHTGDTLLMVWGETIAIYHVKNKDVIYFYGNALLSETSLIHWIIASAVKIYIWDATPEQYLSIRTLPSLNAYDRYRWKKQRVHILKKTYPFLGYGVKNNYFYEIGSQNHWIKNLIDHCLFIGKPYALRNYWMDMHDVIQNTIRDKEKSNPILCIYHTDKCIVTYGFYKGHWGYVQFWPWIMERESFLLRIIQESQDNFQKLLMNTFQPDLWILTSQKEVMSAALHLMNSGYYKGMITARYIKYPAPQNNICSEHEIHNFLYRSFNKKFLLHKQEITSFNFKTWFFLGSWMLCILSIFVQIYFWFKIGQMNVIRELLIQDITSKKKDLNILKISAILHDNMPYKQLSLLLKEEYDRNDKLWKLFHGFSQIFQQDFLVERFFLDHNLIKMRVVCLNKNILDPSETLMNRYKALPVLWGQPTLLHIPHRSSSSVLLNDNSPEFWNFVLKSI